MHGYVLQFAMVPLREHTAASLIVHFIVRLSCVLAFGLLAIILVDARPNKVAATDEVCVDSNADIPLVFKLSGRPPATSRSVSHNHVFETRFHCRHACFGVLCKVKYKFLQYKVKYKFTWHSA